MRYTIAIPCTVAVLLLAGGCAANRQYHGPFLSAEEQRAKAGKSEYVVTTAQAKPAQVSKSTRTVSASAAQSSKATRPASPKPTATAAAKSKPADAAAPGTGTNIYDIRLKHPDLPRPCKLAFVEFDDTGRMFNPQQLGNILMDLRKQKNLALFVFIHGWQNNARIFGEMDEFDPTPEGDAQRFKNYLAILSNTEAIKRNDRTVYGVYLGWRGELLQKSPEPITNRLIMTIPRAATFFSRKAAATRVGDGAAVGATLIALREATQPHDPPLREDPIRIFMGHSFGSKVLEQAVSQWMIREIAQYVGGHPGQRDFTIPRFADLVLFLNSAGESTYTRRLRQALPNEADFGKKQPYFVAVSSDTDMATKVAFPIGTTIGTALGSFQKLGTEGVSEGLFFRRTSVFNQFMKNGQVDLLSDLAWNPDKGVFKRTEDMPLEPLAKPGDPEYVKQAIRAIDYNLTADSFSAEGLFRVYGFNGTVSKIGFYSPKDHPGLENQTAYWVLGVNKNLMDGHSDVWGPNCISLYTKLFRLAIFNRLNPNAKQAGIELRGTHEMQLNMNFDF